MTVFQSVVKPLHQVAEQATSLDWGQQAYIARGFARAAAFQLHNWAAFSLVFNDSPPQVTAEQQGELWRRLSELLTRDYRNVREGLYPASLVEDFRWGDFARTYPRLMLDFPRIRRRARENHFEDVPAVAEEFPKYYRRNFHFQTNGYLGLDSAALYETQVEILFNGTADLMRRQTLPPVVRHLRERDPARGRVLDLACGTGPVLRMLAQALPGAALYGIDLSPHYIAHARRHLQDIVPLSLMVENAEQLPFVDGWFDAVVNVYLLHELPPEVRSRVLGEVFRVLAPGGVFVLADSVQLDDTPLLTPLLEHFPRRFHEPYYRHYVRDDLPGRLTAAGFQVERSEQHLLTKVLVARKPAAAG